MFSLNKAKCLDSALSETRFAWKLVMRDVLLGIDNKQNVGRLENSYRQMRSLWKHVSEEQLYKSMRMTRWVVKIIGCDRYDAIITSIDTKLQSN